MELAKVAAAAVSVVQFDIIFRPMPSATGSASAAGASRLIGSGRCRFSWWALCYSERASAADRPSRYAIRSTWRATGARHGSTVTGVLVERRSYRFPHARVAVGFTPQSVWRR
jgi:hypothetical protein